MRRVRGEVEAEVPTTEEGQEAVVCFRPSPEQGQWLRALLEGPQKWSKSSLLAHMVAHHAHFTQALAPILAELDAYAVQERLTVPKQRRKPSDWEWQLDALVQLAKERLSQLRDSGETKSKR